MSFVVLNEVHGLGKDRTYGPLSQRRKVQPVGAQKSVTFQIKYFPFCLIRCI